MATRRDRAVESYFQFYILDLKSGYPYTLEVASADRTFQVPLTTPRQYHNVYTLNLNTRTMTLGKSWSRTFVLALLRLLATLFIEGAIFLLFGYRKRRSWMAFLGGNLVTVGALNIWLALAFLPTDDYIIFPLFLAEILVIIVEGIILGLTIREHTLPRAAGYVILANVASMIAGFWLIGVLPV